MICLMFKNVNYKLPVLHEFMFIYDFVLSDINCVIY